MSKLSNFFRRIVGRSDVTSRLPAGYDARRPPRDWALVSYVTAPFRERTAASSLKPQADTHTNRWECRQIVDTFLGLGFGVDIIDWHDRRFRPRKEYKFFLDIGVQMERLAPLVGPRCIKILHATGKHWLFQNRAEYERLAALMTRRGVALEPRRIAPTGSGVEAADVLTVLGNQGTIDTLSYAGKPCYRIPLSTTVEFPWNEAKDFAAARKRFLWLGSSGMVHKGLDLALEAFAALPELELTVCGPVAHEPDFAREYHRELNQTPNIRTVGWVDLAGKPFAEIVATVGSLIYPSCSEGCAGSVVSCLHAGLVPIVSRESGVDVEPFGVLLPDCSVEPIRRAVSAMAQSPADELRARSRATWEFARREHTRERFAAEFLRVIETLVGNGQRGQGVEGSGG